MTELTVLKNNQDYKSGYVLCEKYYKFFKSNIKFNEMFGLFSYHVKDYTNSLNCYKFIQEHSNDERMIDMNEFNSHFSGQQLYNSFTHYPNDIIDEIASNVCKDGLITFTITSCKRLDLFVQTVNSFINCCKDIHLISRWICIDDNSSIQDVNTMRRLYPFFEFIIKTDKERGHPKSMNILIDTVKSPYQLHMEDDWVFYYKSNYIERMFDILSSNEKYKQVLFNVNYSEIPEHHELGGGVFKQTLSGTNYKEHLQCDASKIFPGKRTSCYWPHFSFRPSLIDTSIYNSIGKYNESGGHFEMEYGFRYTKAGFISCFLPYIVSRHIGKLTSEKDGVNAYTLNNQSQFVTPKMTFKHVYINLDKRTDRNEEFTFEKQKTRHDITRISAVSGKDLVMTPQHFNIFEGNDYNYRSGIVGCALSHLKLWVDFVNNKYNESHLVIYEDDVKFNNNFDEMFETMIEKIDNNVDVLFFNHHSKVKYKQIPLDIFQTTTSQSFNISYGGTGGYIISKKGAQRMIDYIEERGMTNAIDTMIQLAADDNVNVYYTNTMLVSTNMANNNGVDTDIQMDFTSKDIPTASLILKEYDFLKDKVPLELVKQTVEYNDSNKWFCYKLKNIFISIPIEYSNVIRCERTNERFYFSGKNNERILKIE